MTATRSCGCRTRSRGLYCGDETDGETIRPCDQVQEALYGYEVGGPTPCRSSPTNATPNEDLTQWTCTLREGVKFHDGSTLDAADVILSYAAQWDAASRCTWDAPAPSTYWLALFGGFLNPPAPAAGV